MYNNHSISFVSFANSRYASQNRIKREAEEMQFFDHIYVGDEKMLEPWYFEKYKDRWPERSFGYWQWKPYLIRRVMDRMEEGDFLWNAGLLYLQMVTENPCGVLGFDQHFREAEWTKADLFDYFGVLGDPKYMDHGQVASGCIIIHKKPASQRLVDEWHYIMHFQHDLATDSPSKIPNVSNFQENRHDQSVFSLLMVKYGGVELPVEEFFTEGNWEELKDYPIWATRKRMKKRTWQKEINYRIKKLFHLTR